MNSKQLLSFGEQLGTLRFLFTEWYTAETTVSGPDYMMSPKGRVIVCPNKNILSKVLEQMPPCKFKVVKILCLMDIEKGIIFHIHDIEGDTEIKSQLGCQLILDEGDIALLKKAESDHFRWGLFTFFELPMKEWLEQNQFMKLIGQECR